MTKTRWWKRTKAAGYKENGCQTLSVWTRETRRWNCGRQDSTSTVQGGDPVGGANLQVSGSEGPGSPLNESSAAFLKEKPETQNSEFEISVFICWQLHWEDQTQQMWGLYSVLGPLITLNKITSTLSPAQSTKSNVDFYFSFSVKNTHVQNSCRMVYILLIIISYFKKNPFRSQIS